MKILAFALLAIGMLLLAGCTQTPDAQVPPNGNDPGAIPAQNGSGGPNKVAAEGEFCGGIAAFQCASALECKYDGSYPDAGGICVKAGTAGGNAGMANPASTNCIEKGGQLRIVSGSEGEYGMCTLNGIECEEWDFFRTGECHLTLEKDDAYQAAMQYAKLTPTYAFDGSIIASEYNTTVGSGKYEFAFAYESSHAGYGNREGEALAQMITPHTVVIDIVGDVIVSAITDDEYDEMAGRMFEAGMQRVSEMTQAVCENGGGRWNECASACRNNPEAEACTMQCVQICECGGTANNAPTCPSGWSCSQLNPLPDTGECVPAQNA